jgi:hypothetical protein
MMCLNKSRRDSSSPAHGTFAPNHHASIHRWYPYIEGFSRQFVDELLREFGRPGCRVHDPFAGTGTTVAVAAMSGMQGQYCEINPMMRLVIECKTNGLRALAGRAGELRGYLDAIMEHARKHLPAVAQARATLQAAFNGRPYFAGRRLREVLALKQAIATVPVRDTYLSTFARLILAAIAVACSELKRAADLRYRLPTEILPRTFSAIDAFAEKAAQVRADIDPAYEHLPPVLCLGRSALLPHGVRESVDLVLTSPPYLNGTNYFRNTKIELWLTGFMAGEDELGSFRDTAMTAGINDVSRRGRPPARLPEVEAHCSRLDAVAYDPRIPELVRRYFSDSMTWLQNVRDLLKPGGRALVDTGDSRFAGVHIPTDEILLALAGRCGLAVEETRLIRGRKSKDGTPLKQVLLIMRKKRANQAGSRRHKAAVEFREAAVQFGRALPHTAQPFARRNWGHGLHSLCTYQGKLKPAIAHFLVARFTRPRDRVLDPMAGAGTIPLEASLQGRVALANDVQELAYILCRAKVERGQRGQVEQILEDLLRAVQRTCGDQDASAYAEFGFNGTLPSYFHADTYREVLAARQYLQARPCRTWAQAVVYSGVLHILHGNRPYALSRRSHPVTPLKPRGPRTYRALAPRLYDKVRRTLDLMAAVDGEAGQVSQFSFEDLPYENTVDAVITSPPFAASTRFYSSNWMRLWMAGWEPEDFVCRPPRFLEHRQRASLDVYRDFFACCFRWLRPGGRLILHVGRTAACDMANELLPRALDWFAPVHMVDEDVAGREKFGIRDQGATTAHQYLFLDPRK